MLGTCYNRTAHYGIGRLEFWNSEQPACLWSSLLFGCLYRSIVDATACVQQTSEAGRHATVPPWHTSNPATHGTVRIQHSHKAVVPPPNSSLPGPWFACAAAMAGVMVLPLLVLALLLSTVSLSCSYSHSSGYQGHDAYTREMGEAAMWVSRAGASAWKLGWMQLWPSWTGTIN